MALKSFNAATFLETWSDEKYSPLHSGKTFAQCIREAFDIPASDTYIYRAQAETTLDVTQRAIAGKRAHGLHAWYHDDEGKPTDPPHPTTPEITAYTALFLPSVSLPKALTSLRANAKSQTLRAPISTHLLTRYHASSTPGLLPSKKPRSHKNPYLTLWTYTCHELEWAGPLPSTTHTRTSHHILPILYHHFGCVVPSYAALHVLARLAQPARPSKESVRPILDIGSGTGYWTFLLRNLGAESGMKALDVRAVDSGVSEYRVMWIGDTIRADGMGYLRDNGGGRGCVLLLVYPQATGGFTESVLRAYEGDTVVVAGTQNGNGFTGFRDVGVDEWVGREMGAFELVLRMPLPSFAGKDEALFVFQRRKT
ncbi:hypothetical protein P153DRAFT_344006 [Dothidotthia symphoricarpi CBS 119687]|uniref:Uncharacterized protein n=1 Tax=Dothidotthia symphoricarpi CBS 119687 TaxID=1392245 RepID=A0A6A6A7A8_9PLEO|nr:uncharacterized protein P153DRAFT_344006 [Dothidotthia symphoricarpi CBS 119687]KAF2127710.1 hypothetical protein P153DRAFT_344006 [Dothidotthia symphoricarpi CBS 119687]